MTVMLEKTRALRSEAWAAVRASDAFAAFKALDDAVIAQGGGSAMPTLTGTGDAAMTSNGKAAASVTRRVKPLRPKHSDVAFTALRRKGEPLLLIDWMEAAIAAGADLKGDKALSNFRSAVSKDKRFRWMMRNGKYYWWFTGKPVPPSWNETAGPDLLAGPAESSVHSNPEMTDAATYLASP